MGNAADCSTCCGNEKESGFEIKQDLHRNPSATRIRGRNNSVDVSYVSEASREYIDKYGNPQQTSIESMMTIIRVQSLMRGFLQRRAYRVQKFRNEGTTKYFKEQESNETLGGIYEKNSPIQLKQYTYKTGAIYNGQWKGGIRHGNGTMIWTDGARYEGEWSYNMASGNGKFYHSDGDIYDGKWANNKAMGYGVYTN